MINLLRIAQKLDQKGQYKIADKLTKSASILLMAIQTKQDLAGLPRITGGSL